ncbi:methyltransferase domain-containing protein [Microbacterium protaetiae]|uniref:Methyltransferase domain-containing protein n=1 Tax=Microbacterium protaetiae TaxID=2509458 RepID=A0A4P6ED12_9MICO|nr:methyltransferase domain-containing protein [Microbacterium protaetiae]QAY59556.1 methyltransferase domain-containing protein [Microbacterium protaetiae]
MSTTVTGPAETRHDTAIDDQRGITTAWGGGNPWNYVQGWDEELLGPDVRDAAQRRIWELAVRLAGGLPYIWQELARPISEIAYGLLELRPGDRVLLIGEGIEPAGWDEDMRAIVGPEGTVDTVEIIRDGRKAVHSRTPGRSGMTGCWRWDYMDDIADESYDCVAVMQATQHSDDWAETAGELLRVTKPGRRIFLAEAVLSGPSFFARVDSDVHFRQWFDKLYEQVQPTDIPYYSPAQIRAAFGDRVESPQSMEWKGIEMFWGRKPAA